MSDTIDHPIHYTHGKIECADVIDDWQLHWCPANVLKYICRHKHKGNPLEDLHKALWYAKRYRDGMRDTKFLPTAVSRDWNLDERAASVVNEIWYAAGVNKTSAHQLVNKIEMLIEEVQNEIT